MSGKIEKAWGYDPAGVWHLLGPVKDITPGNVKSAVVTAVCLAEVGLITWRLEPEVPVDGTKCEKCKAF